MTTAQDQQSRELLPCPFCGREAMMSHSRDGEVCNVRCAGWSVGNCLGAGPNCYTEADAVAGWNRRAPAVQAARALPTGIEPVAWLHINGLGAAQAFTSEPPPGFAAQCAPLYTAAQVQAMGRVTPGWQAVPVAPSSEMVQAGVEDLRLRGYKHALIVGAVEVWRAMLAAAPRPPAAQEDA